MRSRINRREVAEYEAEAARVARNRTNAPRAAFLVDVLEQAIQLVRRNVATGGNRWLRTEESNLWHLQQQIEGGIFAGQEVAESAVAVVAKALLRVNLVIEPESQNGRAVVREKE